MPLATPRRFSILAIVLVIVVLAFAMSGCSQLSERQSTIDKKFLVLIPDLTLRYNKLEAAINIAETVGGKRDVTQDAKTQLKKFDDAKKKKNTSAQLDSARELETIIGRLRANAISSPKLAATAELNAALAEIDAAYPGSDALDDYYDSVESYENKRKSWRYLFSSTLGGYNAPERLEMSEPPTTTTPETTP